MYHGWTQYISREQRRQNEIASVLALCEEHPASTYWRARLFNLLGGSQSAAAVLTIALPQASTIPAASFPMIALNAGGTQ